METKEEIMEQLKTYGIENVVITRGKMPQEHLFTPQNEVITPEEEEYFKNCRIPKKHNETTQLYCIIL